MTRKYIIFPIFIFFGFISLSCQHHKHHRAGHHQCGKCSSKHHLHGKSCKSHKYKRHCAKHHKGHYHHKYSKCSAKHHKHKCLKKEGIAVISSLNDSQIEGSVQFTKKSKKSVIVSARITGLEPQKKYGFHIHQYGDCRNKGEKAGTHLNPYRTEHGSHDSKNRHMGDLGNLESDANGVAVYKQTIDICMRKLSGRSVIIHAQKDDLKSQPSGNSGPYIGCGVIGWTSIKDE